jgi:hypothetical protein
MRSCKSQHNTLLSCQASSDFPSIKSKIVQAQSPSSTLPLVSDAEGGVDDKVHCSLFRLGNLYPPMYLYFDVKLLLCCFAELLVFKKT